MATPAKTILDFLAKNNAKAIDLAELDAQRKQTIEAFARLREFGDKHPGLLDTYYEIKNGYYDEKG